MAAIGLGVLVVTAVTAFGLARRNAVQSAEHSLQNKAPTVATQLERLGRALRARKVQGAVRTPGLAALLSTVLNTSGGGLVTVEPGGTVTDGVVGLGNAVNSGAAAHLPQGVNVENLDQSALLRGEPQTGHNGGTAFVAQPLTPTKAGTPVLVLTQPVDSIATKGRGFFLIGGALAALLALGLAYYFSRRLTRPLQVMDDTAQRLAAGDLSARVELGGHPDDELARLAATLNAMAAQIEESRGRERNFVLSVSHDLRTPLTAIRGYAEALTDGTIPASADQRRAGEVIRAESRRLERLVADLLDLARLDAHQFSLHPRTVDVAELVRTTSDGFEPAANDAGVRLDVTTPEQLRTDLDPDRLGQVIANLLENALKYAHGEIAVTLVQHSGWIELRVVDDGPGIPASDLGRVFDRLYVSRSTQGRSVGTGLGLAIVRELSSAMSGDVHVTSEAGSGASFVVRLPLARSDAMVTHAAPVSGPAVPRP
jgi:two-component system sensor histidine kinase BaeS